MLSPPSLIQHHRQPAGGGKALEDLENRSGAAILKPVEWKHHCGSGGTGRRARLRILWPKGRGGSNPSFRTKTSLKAKYSPIVSTSAAKRFPVLYNLPFCIGWEYPSPPVNQHVKRPLNRRA